ncbi:UNVERIFIED_CONTAM: hypothetical protein Sradi_2973200 [Sesamum radiatum]|uniref:Retrotransposon gag domain-containing protein n=1 Tax=Sesamum radiatum TaxID=300843 RepID=A0AAW2S140_SESRA
MVAAKAVAEGGGWHAPDTGMAQEAIQMQPHTLLGPEDSPLQDLDVASNDKVMGEPVRRSTRHCTRPVKLTAILSLVLSFSFFIPPKLTQALEDAVHSLTERLAELHASLEQHIQSSSLRHDSLASSVADLRLQIQTHSASSASSPPLLYTSSSSAPLPQFPSALVPKPPKLHLPPFDGSEPLDWIFQAEQYFTYHQVAPPQRLAIISFFMHGEALSWFKWVYNNNQLTSWEAFLRALELRFGPSSFVNHQATLFKLRQRGSVADFQAEFERLCNRVVGLSPESILNCFISGLRPDIQREIAVL